MMDILSSLWFGIIQGLTEFLPVSSSGHLAIAHQLGLGAGLSEHDELTFDVLLHGASLGAIIAAFAPRLWTLARWSQCRVWLLLLAASIPAGLAGYLAEPLVSQAGDSWWLLAGTYTATAAWLLWAHRATQRSEQITSEQQDSPHSHTASISDWSQLNWSRAALIGLAQIPALLPGISRSGASLGAGLLAGCDRRFAVEVAFFIGLPLISGAVLYKGSQGGYGHLVASIGYGPVIAGCLASFISGLLAIWLLQLVTQRGRLTLLRLVLCSYCIDQRRICYR